MSTRRVADLQDALEHAGEQGDVLEQLRLEDFTVSPARALRLQDAYRFDDVGAWAEWQKGELAAESPTDRRHAVTSFRGKDWAARALAWTPKTMPPIVIVERVDGTTVIGDGRGRVATRSGWAGPRSSVFLKERKRRTPQGRAAGQKLVVMNGVTRHIKGLPEPTRPIDDFSVALWAFAELVLEKNKGLEVAQINYWGGRALHNLYEARDQALPKHTVAQFWFFHNAALYVRARKQNSWAAHVLDLDVHADGSLWRRMRSGKSYWESKRVGNLLTWKFSKAALTAPRVVEA